MSDDLDKMEEERHFLDGFRLPTELELESEARNSPTPKAITLSVEWESHRDELVKVRRVKRELEMLMDMFVDGMEMIQFCGDVELYGLYEAVLMLPKAHKEKIMDEILVDIRLKALPKRRLEDIRPDHKLLPTKPKTLRAESIWTLQKHLIVGQAFDKQAEQIFIRALPAHKSQQYIDIAKTKNVWEGVVAAPIENREALAARLLTYYSIPEPVAKVVKHLVRNTPPPTRGDRVLVIDKAGNAWTWRCGWFRVGEDGHRIDTKPVLGHASFKRNIKPADANDFARTSFRYTRPWGQWRRGSGPVYSDIYKMTGTLILTDGMHAVVEFSDGIKREVILDNLTSVAERTVRKTVATDKMKTTKVKPTKKELTLEEMMKML